MKNWGKSTHALFVAAVMSFTPLQAFADDANPVVVAGSGTVSSSTAIAGDSIVVSYRVTDDSDCCNPHDVYMYDSNGDWVMRKQASMVSGTKTDARYSATFDIVSSIEAGNYIFRSQVTDKAGKFSGLVQVGTLRVEAAVEDSEVPDINSPTLSAERISQGQSVRVSWTVTDNVGCCTNQTVYLRYSMGGPVYEFNDITKVSGDARSARYTTIVNFPDRDEPLGHFISLTLTDNAGNTNGTQYFLGQVFMEGPIDRQDPKVESSSGIVSQKRASSGDRMTVSWIVSDNVECCSSSSLNIVKNGVVVKTYNNAQLISGNKTRGRFQTTFNVPGQLAPGNYELRAKAIDRARNSSDSVRIGTFEVLAEVDTENPVVVAGSGRLSSNQAIPGDLINVTYRVTDDLDCCNPHDVFAYDSRGNLIDRSQARQISGTQTSGTFQASFRIDDDFPSGSFTFKSQVTDASDKFSDLVELGTLSVSTNDTVAPVINASVATINRPSASAGDQVDVSYQVIDAGECCNAHDVYLYDDEGNWVLRERASMVSDIGNKQIYEIRFRLPSGLRSGDYVFRTQVVDSAGNFSDLVRIATLRVEGSSDTQPPSVQRNSGIVSPSFITPGESLTATFGVSDDAECCSLVSLSLVDEFGNKLETAQAKQVSKTSSSIIFSGNLKTPASASGVYFLEAIATDKSGKQSSETVIGSVSIDSDSVSIPPPRNLRYVDGRGLKQSTVTWDAPDTDSKILGYEVEILTQGSDWKPYCETVANFRGCFLENREINGSPVLGYRVAATTDDGLGAFSARNLPSGISYLGDPVKDESESVTASDSASSGQKVNAGSFKGYVAIYAKGHKGSKLSAKVGKDWIIVESLASDFERITDFTGPGVDIAVRIYIDRVLQRTINLTTK